MDFRSDDAGQLSNSSLHVNAIFPTAVSDPSAPTSITCPRDSAPLQTIRDKGALDENAPDLGNGSPPLPPLTSLPSSRSPSSITEVQISNKRKREIERAKAASKKNRTRKRQESKPTNGPTTGQAHARRKKHLHTPEVRTSFSLETNTCVTSTALRDGPCPEITRSLQELVGPDSKYGMDLLAWDGRTPTPIFSSGAEGRLCALLVGSPDEENWSSVNVDATELLEAHRSNISSKEHRRGQFMCRDVGVFHDTDTAKPCNLVHNEKETQTLDTLCQHKIFKRLSGFANSIFDTWAPRLYSYYSTCQKKLLESDPSLKTPFPNSIWSTATFDFGPQTVCFPRVGDSNLPFEWCAIWALGDYDPKQSAHLILWDLRLVIEFPPGSLVFVPSGILVRSNVSIRQHEKRYSFTQYTPGSLFRWVDDQGCQEQTEHGVSQTDAQVQEEEAEKAKKRWTMGLELLPTFSELKLSSSS